MSDLRFAVRMLAKSPGFTFVVVVPLAAGIGASALIFSALDAVLLRPLPVRHPEELVRMVQRIPRIGTRSEFHYSFYQALREHSTTLSAVFGEAPLNVTLNEPAPAEQIQVNMSTPEFFDALGVRPLYGRMEYRWKSELTINRAACTVEIRTAGDVDYSDTIPEVNVMYEPRSHLRHPQKYAAQNVAVGGRPAHAYLKASDCETIDLVFWKK